MRAAARLSIVAGILAGTAMSAAPAIAAPQTEMVTCDGHQLTIRVNESNSSENGGWGSVQIVSGGSGHLTPTTFSFTLVDTTINQTLFQFTGMKGNGNANQNQATITCSQTFSGTLAEFRDPSEPLPPGTSLTDQVTFTLTATVVHKP